MLPGPGVWWKEVDGTILNMDGPDDPDYHEEGPFAHHFRNVTLHEVEESLQTIWKEICES